MLGAWPVTGFMGLDVVLVWWAFRTNFAAARQAERIEVTEHELILERLGRKAGPEERRFVRGWVWVELEEDREPRIDWPTCSLHPMKSAPKSAASCRRPIRQEFARELKSVLGEPHI